MNKQRDIGFGESTRDTNIVIWYDSSLLHGSTSGLELYSRIPYTTTEMAYNNQVSLSFDLLIYSSFL